MRRLSFAARPELVYAILDSQARRLDAAMDQIGTEGKSRPANEWKRATTLEEAVANPLPGAEYN